MTDPRMQNAPQAEVRGVHRRSDERLTEAKSTAPGADLLALADYAYRSDVMVLVFVKNRAGRWRREPFLSLTGARNRYLKARKNGLEAVMVTTEFKATFEHAGALSALSADLEEEAGR